MKMNIATETDLSFLCISAGDMTHLCSVLVGLVRSHRLHSDG
jgi:hypothetical protein